MVFATKAWAWPQTQYQCSYISQLARSIPNWYREKKKQRKKDHVRAAENSQEMYGNVRSTFSRFTMSCPVTNDGDHKSTKSKESKSPENIIWLVV